MERQTPAAVRKHYKKLLDYNKPIPYGYIMMKRKKQWSKGRTIIAYSNTCVGRLLRVAALALQQMLKATWPHHFGNIATPQLWQEVHQLFQANEEQPERELILYSSTTTSLAFSTAFLKLTLYKACATSLQSSPKTTKTSC